MTPATEVKETECRYHNYCFTNRKNLEKKAINEPLADIELGFPPEPRVPELLPYPLLVLPIGNEETLKVTRMHEVQAASIGFGLFYNFGP
ncbi:hypothetical protein L1987_59164 [Smallanthus sonchifolius]|uniref:Uncharacterized protein n=1 Tax=Smallanthus sonchifolius TaxID=185202 RepID=A0ACB9D4R4_9ASTR|nr:hypothetical protein L1987_59164 [Smallanthus sonchifolius]